MTRRRLRIDPAHIGKRLCRCGGSAPAAVCGFLLLFLVFAAAGFVLHPAAAPVQKDGALAQSGGSDSETDTTREGSGTVSADHYKEGVNKGWVKKNGYVYYYKNGKPLKGLRAVGKRTYLFDGSGRQQTGWRRVGEKVHYFQIENGRKGYMLTGTQVNGVSIRRNGNARAGGRIKQKVELLLRYQKLIDKMTCPLEDKHTKLVRAFKYARDFRQRDMGQPSYAWNWDQIYAERFLPYLNGDCVSAACGFAYMANAIGYKNVTVRLYYHCHCEINKRIYDPGFAQTVADYNYTRFFDRAYSDLPSWGTGPGINTKHI